MSNQTDEAWTVRSCIDVAGNHTCWDVCLPSRSDDRGVGVVASVFGDKQTAELIAAAPRLASALEIAASRFRFLAEMQRLAGRPESKGNANILERHAEECLAAVSNTEQAKARLLLECPECGGAGWVIGTDAECCGRSEYECGGRGCVGPFQVQVQDQCEFCGGNGRIAASADTRPEGGDSTKIEAPLASGAVVSKASETPND